MEKFNLLIVLLQAYLFACKDFHYFCNNFSLHLLADEIMASDDLEEVIDGIKENVFIAVGNKPLTAKKYATAIASATPVIKETDKENLRQLYQFAKRIENIANSIKPNRRCENVLLDTIADKMAHAETLLEIELRATGLNEDLEMNEELDSLIAEAEEIIKVEHDHKANVEKPIDRKEAKVADIDYKKVADTVLNYSAQNIPEENTLDDFKIADRLDVLTSKLMIN